tara:strand:- start:332 stop:1501 length:1170 start_codon:yes stop_codon:yes gene_type:complete
MRDKPYCNAPWLGLAYEATKGCQPCCEWKKETFWGTYEEYVKSDYLKNFKKMMYSDKPNSGCIECTHNEKIGGYSRRHYYEKWNNDVDYETLGLNYIARMDFRAGNKCNMKCRMCGPQSSSLLEEEAGITIKTIDTSDVYDLDLTHCEEISILGGEPSIDLKVRKFMNHVADNYPNIEILVTTNATNASEKWFKTLLRFCTGPGLRIILSVDAAGPTQDFQRSGGDWNKIKKNLMKYKSVSKQHGNKFNITIQLTASALNMTTLDKWWDELLRIGIKVDINQVWWPKGMSISAMPDEYKKQSIKFLEDWLQEIINPMILDKEIEEHWKFSALDLKEHKIDAAESAIRILKGTEYSEDARKEFIELQNRYDSHRNENVIELDERFKVMMI